MEAVVDNADARRFETTVDGHRAQLTYHRNGNRLVLLHTEVPDELSGRGIAGALVEAAVDAAIKGGLTVVPRCPFARSWLQQHPDTAGRVAIDWPEE